MANDDDISDDVDEVVDADAEETPEDFDADVADPEDLEEADLEEDAFVADDDDEFAVVEEEEEEEDEEEGKPESPLRRTTAEDEDDDDDLLTPDDVEADLDTILKDRLVSAEEAAGGDDDEDEEPEDRSDTGDRLQPKRPDEQLCSNCFLLVRNSAPGCPVGADDDCPIFG